MSDLIRKNDKYYKEHEVIILPTKDKTSIAVSTSQRQRLCLVNKIKSTQETKQEEELVDAIPYFQLPVSNVEFKHLYILLNEQIPYNPNGGTNGLFLCLHELEHPEDAIVKNVGNCTGCRKIIASTDISLTIKVKCKNCNATGFDKAPNTCSECYGKGFKNEPALPKLSEDFIKKYVESNGSIKKVLVEYEISFDNSSNYSDVGHVDFKYSLKLNPDNTINILLENSVEEAAKNFSANYHHEGFNAGLINAFKAGAEWQKNNN